MQQEINLWSVSLHISYLPAPVVVEEEVGGIGGRTP